MGEVLKQRFKDNNYILSRGDLGENRLLAVNHICIQGDCVLFEDMVLPFGEAEIEDIQTGVIAEIIQELVFKLQSKSNREKTILICGNDRPRRILGRKLEDRLKREVSY